MSILQKQSIKGIAIYYIIPSIFVIALIYIYPIFEIIKGSFYRKALAEQVFVGLGNYRYIFSDRTFWLAIQHNVTLLLLVPIIVFAALILAVFIFDRIPGWKIFRSVVIIPYLLASTVVGVLFSNLFELNGVVNTILRSMKLDFLALDWLGNPKIALFTIMFVIFWKEIGFGVMIFFARLMSIPESILEASIIDGANWWKRFIYIIIPQVRAVIEFYTIIVVITLLGWVFNYVYVMTLGGPGQSTVVTELYIYKQGFSNRLLNIATTSAVVLFIISIVFVAMLMIFINRAQKAYE